MIPSTWLPHTREDDGELLGYLVPVGDGWQPATLFGLRFGDPATEDVAREFMDGIGLSYLIEPWLLRMPDGSEHRVNITEVTPDHVSVLPRDIALVMGHPDVDMSKAVVLDVPTERLTPPRPIR